MKRGHRIWVIVENLATGRRRVINGRRAWKKGMTIESADGGIIEEVVAKPFECTEMDALVKGLAFNIQNPQKETV